MNLEDEIANKLSNEIAKEIDFEIISSILIESCGWTKAQLPSLLNRKRSIDVLLWCEEFCKGKWKHSGRTFLFEQQGDAVNFLLRWR